LAAIALHNFAPASLSVSLVAVGSKVTLEVGNITGSQQFNWNCPNCPASVGTTTGDLLSSVLEMEQLFSYPYSFEMQPNNCSVGLPSIIYLQNGTKMSYSTESGCWSHQCQWVEDLSYDVLDIGTVAFGQ
jgi:hypothetical protein